MIHKKRFKFHSGLNMLSDSKNRKTLKNYISYKCGVLTPQRNDHEINKYMVRSAGDVGLASYQFEKISNIPMSSFFLLLIILDVKCRSLLGSNI